MKHILIDFENTRPEAEQLNALSVDDCHIWLFLGALQQKTLSVDLCEALCRFGQQVHFVRIARSGKNALDFYLAYYLGKITEQDSEALICILSRDTGFDVLIEHLENNDLCRGIVRLGEVSDAAQLSHEAKSELHILPSVVEVKLEEEIFNNLVSQIVGLAMTYLRQEDAFRPKSRRNLESGLQKLVLANEITAEGEHVAAAVDKLLAKGILSVNDEGLLLYHFTHKDLVEKIVQHVAKCKPKSLTALHNVLRSQAKFFALQDGEDDLAIFVDFCYKKGILRVNGSKVEYAPFIDVEKTSVSHTENKELANTNQIFAQQMQLFFSKFQKNKPKKRDSLIAGLKTLLKIDDAQVADLLKYMQSKKRISISSTGKVQYL